MRRIRTQLMSLSDIELAALASALLAAIETFTELAADLRELRQNVLLGLGMTPAARPQWTPT